MDTGLDKAQWEAVRSWWSRTTGDHVRLRFALCTTLFLASYLTLLDPLDARLDAARKGHRKALKREHMAEELVHFTRQLERLEPRLVESADIVDWQNYVFAKLEAAGASLHSVEPRGTESRHGFRIVEMEILARSDDYARLVDFVDRLEHGERIVRLEKLLIERQPRSLLLTCTLKGLVKPRAGAPVVEGAG